MTTVYVQKFGEIYYSSTENIIYWQCSLCNSILECEDSFWEHFAKNHHFNHPSKELKTLGQEQPLEQAVPSTQIQNSNEDIDENPEDITNDPLTVNLTSFTTADELINEDLNDESGLELLREDVSENDFYESNSFEEMFNINENTSSSAVEQADTINVEALPSEQLLNGDVLKNLLLHIQQEQAAQKEEQKKLSKTLQNLKRANSTPPLSAPTHTTAHLQEDLHALQGNKGLLPKKPFDSIQVLFEYDNDLKKNDELRMKLLEELIKMKVEPPGAYIRMMWQRYMSDELGQKFTWNGTKDVMGQPMKHSLQHLQLCDLIEAAFLSHFRGSVSRETFKTRTKIFLNECSVRIRKKLANLKKQPNDYSTPTDSKTQNGTNAKKGKYENMFDSFAEEPNTYSNRLDGLATDTVIVANDVKALEHYGVTDNHTDGGMQDLFDEDMQDLFDEY